MSCYISLVIPNDKICLKIFLKEHHLQEQQKSESYLSAYGAWHCGNDRLAAVLEFTGKTLTYQEPDR